MQVKKVIKALQPTAKILETNYAKVDVGEVIDTNNFDFEKISSSAGWIKELEKDEDNEEHEHHNNEDEHDEEHDEDGHEHHHDEDNYDHEEHEHHHGHHHHHHHDEGEAEEYGISTFVYTSRKPLNEQKFEEFVNDRFPKTVIRCKGLVWFANDYNMSYLFEQAGRQMQLSQTGYWIASAPENELKQMIEQEPNILKDWDEEVGDRMVKLVFIGKNMNKEEIINEMENCH